MRRIAAAEQAIAEFQARDFEWGDADCMAFICAYLARAGLHPDGIKHGGWRSERAALRAVRAMGHDSLASLLGAYFPRVPRICARDGDLALVKTDDEWGGAAGIVAGRRVHAMGPAGLVRLPLHNILFCWRP